MGHHHDHGHSHPRIKDQRRLEILIVINLLGMIVEIVGGYITNSLALLSDAGHMFTHLFSLIVAYIAIRISSRLKDEQMTFGYQRMEILAAFFNGLTVIGIVFLIGLEAFEKFMHPTPVVVGEMFGIAVFGLVINLVSAYIITESAKKDINLRAVFIHLLSDTFSSVAILAGGVIIHYTGWYIVDTIASLVIALIIAYWGIGLIRSSGKILLQAVPESINTDAVVKAILEVPNVKGVHHVHIWELTTHNYIMTGHILTDDLSVSESRRILDLVNALVHDRFHIGHTTFQVECSKDHAAHAKCT